MTNKLNKISEQKKIEDQRKKKKDPKIGKAAQSIMDGTILTKDKVVRLLPFVLYLTLLIIIYVANSYYAEKTMIQMDRLKQELEELRYQYISSKSNLMFIGQQSEVAKRLEKQGIKESKIPPHKIIQEKENRKKN
jgi:hypothetical protein